MRRVRLITGGTIVGHIEFYSLPLSGPGEYLCVPQGVLSDLDAQAIAEALDRGEVVGQLGNCGWQSFLETAAPVPPR
jgi:hypothetical protein